MQSDLVQVPLTRHEALVLFEWLSRETDSATSTSQLHFDDPAEEHVLWTLEGKLEKRLSEQFSSNYNELLAAARNEVRDRQSPVD